MQWRPIQSAITSLDRTVSPSPLTIDASTPSASARHFEYDFVSFDVDQQLVTLDRFARLFVPLGNGAIGNGFRERGGFDLNSHYL
jgi:hypothetical protein